MTPDQFAPNGKLSSSDLGSGFWTHEEQRQRAMICNSVWILDMSGLRRTTKKESNQLDMTSRIRNVKGHTFLSALMVQRGCLIAQFDTWAQTPLCTDVYIAHAWDTMVYTASIHI